MVPTVRMGVAPVVVTMIVDCGNDGVGCWIYGNDGSEGGIIIGVLVAVIMVVVIMEVA